MLGSLNAGELAQRRFREIARIAGLVFAGYPGAPKSARQLQASSSLFYDVFRKYDPDNLLLTQAQEEVLRQELEVDRLERTLLRLQTRQLDIREVARPTPFAFPLLVERFREHLSSEKLADRIARMVQALEIAAGGAKDDLEETARADILFSMTEPGRAKSAQGSRRVRKRGQPGERPADVKRTRIIPPKPRHGF